MPPGGELEPGFSSFLSVLFTSWIACGCSVCCGVGEVLEGQFDSVTDASELLLLLLLVPDLLNCFFQAIFGPLNGEANDGTELLLMLLLLVSLLLFCVRAVVVVADVASACCWSRIVVCGSVVAKICMIKR